MEGRESIEHYLEFYTLLVDTGELTITWEHVDRLWAALANAADGLRCDSQQTDGIILCNVNKCIRMLESLLDGVSAHAVQAWLLSRTRVVTTRMLIAVDWSIGCATCTSHHSRLLSSCKHQLIFTTNHRAWQSTIKMAVKSAPALNRSEPPCPGTCCSLSSATESRPAVLGASDLCRRPRCSGC